jgi:hypothetical protein
LFRVAELDITGTDTTYFDGITLYEFRISQKVMQNYRVNPDNEIYGVNITGTANMTSFKHAKVLATKGHYLDFEPEMSHILPVILNRTTKEPILPERENDDTIIKAESNTGANIWTKERLMINFHMENDKLWDGEEFLIPLIYVEKQSIPPKKLFEAQFNKLAWAKTE